MFTTFFLELRAAKVPASLREYLTLIEAMREGVAAFDIDDFYFLSRATLVKDERYLDRFDRVFGQCFKGLETPTDPTTELPEEWLKKLAERYLTEEEKAQIEALGGWDKLMDTLRQRDPKKLIPPLHGALLKNEQDVHLFERLAFLNRRERG